MSALEEAVAVAGKDVTKNRLMPRADIQEFVTLAGFDE